MTDSADGDGDALMIVLLATLAAQLLAKLVRALVAVFAPAVSGQQQRGATAASLSPEAAQLRAEISADEERARALCSPDTFVEYARLERAIAAKQQRLRAMVNEARASRLPDAAPAARSGRGAAAAAALRLLTKAAPTLSYATLLFKYGRQPVLYFPCWVMRYAPPYVVAREDADTCSLRGAAWLCLCATMLNRLVR